MHSMPTSVRVTLTSRAFAAAYRWELEKWGVRMTAGTSSTGSAPHLRFDERNAHAQRKVCNRWGAGRAVDYRIGLVARIGLAAVEALESDNTPRKWLREELIYIRDRYRAKLKELKGRA